MEARTRQLRNGWVITLVTLAILLPVRGLAASSDVLPNHVRSNLGTWTAKCGMSPDGLACMSDGTMPEGREGFATSLINDQIIVTHGSVSCGFPCVEDTADTRIYTISTNKWSTPTTTGDTPVARAELAGATNGTLHYAVGGRTCTDDCSSGSVLHNLEVYDPVAKTWTDLTASAPMPTARAGLAAAVVDNKLYAIGGRTGFEPGTGTALNDLEAYDIGTGMWNTNKCNTEGGLKCMPVAAMDVAAIAVGGKIYVIGGASAADDGGAHLLNTVQIYDVKKDRWSAGSMMPILLANLALAVCAVDPSSHSVILALGGRNGVASPGNNTVFVQAYEIPDDKWTVGLNPMPTSKSEHGAVSQGGVVHVLGSGIFGNPQNFHEALTCSTIFTK